MQRIESIVEKYIGKEKKYSVRQKNGKIYYTDLPPEERSMDNIPRYSDGKSRIGISEWLQLEKSPELWPKLRNVSWGWSPNGRVYGWSHRAIHGFKKGEKVRRDTIGNDSGKEFTIKDHRQAEMMAKKFASEVS